MRTHNLMSLLVLAITLLTGCVFEGTGTGNPMLNGPGMGDPAASQPVTVPAVDLVAAQLCLRAVSCHSDWTVANCMAGIYPMTGFADKLGVTIQPEPTLAEIRVLEIKGQLTPDGPSLRSCLDDIKAFDCSTATDQDTPATLATWLGPSCASVEKSPSTSQ